MNEHHAPIAEVPRFTKDDLPKIDPGTKRVLDDAAAHDAALDMPSLSEPAPDAPGGVQENGAGSPTTVASAEAQLLLRLTHLNETIPGLQETAERAAFDLRAAKNEKEQTERLVRYMRKVRNPQRRAKVTA